MNHDVNGAAFGAMTVDQQAGVNGGDGFASMVGFFVNYAASCAAQAMVVNYTLLTKGYVTFIEGRGWVAI